MTIQNENYIKTRIIEVLFLCIITNTACAGERSIGITGDNITGRVLRFGQISSAKMVNKSPRYINKQLFKDYKNFPVNSLGLKFITKFVIPTGVWVTKRILFTGNDVYKAVRDAYTKNNVSVGFFCKLPIIIPVALLKSIILNLSNDVFYVTKSCTTYIGKSMVKTVGSATLGYYAQPVAYKVLSSVVPSVCNNIVEQTGMRMGVFLVNSNFAIKIYAFLLSSAVATWGIRKGQQWLYNQNNYSSGDEDYYTLENLGDESTQHEQVSWKTDILRPIGLSVLTLMKGGMIGVSSWFLGGVSQPLESLFRLTFPGHKLVSVMVSGLTITYIVDLYSSLSQLSRWFWNISKNNAIYGISNIGRYFWNISKNNAIYGISNIGRYFQMITNKNAFNNEVQNLGERQDTVFLNKLPN